MTNKVNNYSIEASKKLDSSIANIDSRKTGKGSGAGSASVFYFLAQAMQNKLDSTNQCFANNSKYERDKEIIEQAMNNIKDLDESKAILDYLIKTTGVGSDVRLQGWLMSLRDTVQGLINKKKEAIKELKDAIAKLAKDEDLARGVEAEIKKIEAAIKKDKDLINDYKHDASKRHWYDPKKAWDGMKILALEVAIEDMEECKGGLEIVKDILQFSIVKDLAGVGNAKKENEEILKDVQKRRDKIKNEINKLKNKKNKTIVDQIILVNLEMSLVFVEHFIVQQKAGMKLNDKTNNWLANADKWMKKNWIEPLQKRIKQIGNEKHDKWYTFYEFFGAEIADGIGKLVDGTFNDIHFLMNMSDRVIRKDNANIDTYRAKVAGENNLGEAITHNEARQGAIEAQKVLEQDQRVRADLKVAMGHLKNLEKSFTQIVEVRA